MEHFRHPIQTNDDKLMAEITQFYVKEVAELRENLRLANNELFRLTGKNYATYRYGDDAIC